MKRQLFARDGPSTIPSSMPSTTRTNEETTTSTNATNELLIDHQAKEPACKAETLKRSRAWERWCHGKRRVTTQPTNNQRNTNQMTAAGH